MEKVSAVSCKALAVGHSTENVLESKKAENTKGNNAEQVFHCMDS